MALHFTICSGHTYSLFVEEPKDYTRCDSDSESTCFNAADSFAAGEGT